MATRGPFEPGARDRAITLEQMAAEPTPGEDSGFPVEAWSTLAAPVWAQKVERGGGETFKAAQSSGKADTLWNIGYRGDMDPELLDIAKLRRLTYQGRVYEIVLAEICGRREAIDLITLSKVA